MQSGRWKLVEFFEDGRLELYDLESDPGEATNLATDRPEIVTEMRRLLAEWRTTVGAAMPTMWQAFFVQFSVPVVAAELIDCALASDRRWVAAVEPSPTITATSFWPAVILSCAP